MQKKQKLYTQFVVLVVLSLTVIFLSQKNVFPFFEGVIQQVLLPLQKTAFGGLVRVDGEDTPVLEQLRRENAKFIREKIDQKILLDEVKALRDQFQTASVQTKQLLPVTVVGMQYSPVSMTIPTTLIIDKGRAHGVATGTVVVYQDNLVGSVGKVSERISRVDLVTHKNLSFPVTTINTSALGIIQGADAGMVLDGVVLSERLDVGDIVITKGNVTEQGTGFPPNLVVGTIVAVNKKASALFQTAEVQSKVPFSKLTTVFLLSSHE